MEVSAESDNDPCGWSIDQVVYELCQNPTPRWSPAERPQLIPDRHVLEDTLRQNHVDGDNFLALDLVALKEDLGIASFGQRRAIMRAIEYFRAHSISWQHSAFRVDSIARMQPQSLAYTSTQIAQSHTSAFPQTPYSGLGIYPSVESMPPTASPLSYRTTGQPGFATALSPHGHALLEASNASFTVPLNATPSSLQHPVVNPTAPDPPKALSLVTNDTTARDASKRPRQGYEVVKGKKKIAPTLVSQTEEITATEAVGTAYLSPSAVPLQDVFYHKISTDFGDVFYRAPLDTSDDFFISGRYPEGQRKVIARRIKHFLRQDVVKLSQANTLIKLPYSHNRLQEPFSEQYFTMFPRRGGQIRVFRVEDFPEVQKIVTKKSEIPATNTILSEHHSNSHTDPAKEDSEDTSNWHDLDYLLDKYPVEGSDEGLPVYGDSGDEGDLDEETWREIQEEQDENSREPVTMTHAEIVAAIDETIEEMKQEWRDTKLVKVQLKAYRLWTEAAKRRDRRDKLGYVIREKDRFERMKTKIQRALADDIWRTPAELKKQCQNIELAVFQYEEFNYYNQVLLDDNPPTRPSSAALKKARTRKPQELSEGEELLESDSDPITEDEDFLVDDSSDAGSIHHEPDLDWNPLISEVTNKTSVQPVAQHVAQHVAQPVARPVFPPPVENTPQSSETATPSPVERAASIPVDTRTHGEDDADIDSDTGEDAIVTPMRRPLRLEISATPSVKIKSAPTTPFASRVLEQSSNPQRKGSDSENSDSDLDRPPRLPKSKYRAQGRTVAEPVDLTFSSPASENELTTHEEASTDFEVHTPELNPTPMQTPQRHKTKTSSSVSSMADSASLSSEDDSGLPHIENVEGMIATDWSDIEALVDRRRALAKAVYQLDAETIEYLSLFIESRKTFTRRRDVIFDGLLALSEVYDDSGDGYNDIRAIGTAQQSSAQLLVLLYITYVCGQNMVGDSAPSEAHKDCAFDDMETTVDPFYSLLQHIIRIYVHKEKQDPTLLQQQSTKKKRKRERPLSDADMWDHEPLTDVIWGDPLEPYVPPSSHKKRKRKVLDSQQAIDMQQSDQVRIQQQEQRRQQLAMKLTQMAEEGDNRHPINTIEPYIYLHPHISKRIKPHQLTGIQFMWRELIEDPKHQGCILAHTMGLGKTMQVISLLVAISLCNQSSDATVRDLIPARLRKSRTLILCPASLVENWLDELLLWTPSNDVLGTIYKLDTSNTGTLHEWSRHGGVLLTSYERFRRMVSKSIGAKDKGGHIDVEKIFFEDPTLVIADEAHKLKNSTSTINQYAKRFKTTSRIALTGSPLNNHLEEYYTMVDWIAPGYLGTIVHFRSKYSEPIIEGLYSDSSAFERRLCLRKLHVLKRDLDPKINRADISAIEKDMPTKTEFFITVPLTELQKRAYNIYVKYMLETFSRTNAKSRNAKMWDWIAMLSWLCHHPFCFLIKLKERIAKIDEELDFSLSTAAAAAAEESKDAAPNQLADITSPENVKEDAQLDTTGPLNEAMQQVLELFKEVDIPGVIDDPTLSYRTFAVQQILKEANANGDKTLVFTHSIPTLNYLEKMLKMMKFPYFRLDGKTDVSTRQASTKDFNQKNTSQVFLISMRAGGLGLNLQGANRVIIFDFSFNPSWEEQAIGRAYRLNQKAPVFVYRFQSGGTFEDVLFNKAVFKTQLFGRVVDKKKPKRHASKSTADYLFPVKDVPRQDFADCLGKDPKVLDIVIQRLDCVRSIVLTETFQKEEDEQLNDEEQKAAEEEFRDQRLQREDPVAWQAKQAALYASATRFPYPSTHPGPVPGAYPPPMPSSTAPSFPSRGGAVSQARPAQPAAIMPPFARQDFDAPPDGHPNQFPSSTMPGALLSYDDTFQDFVDQIDHRRAGSLDPDILMS
ncbi:hypothetical protein A1O3_01677 [Capronia epimyces CBS 606.96]|uniref:Adenosinetriphosphatase n=1 Tax=Capronia epimyces CBS 606.96 TaxID=1182542 RepID=W9YTW2_9EURO|nr:uncharacterized protein A1O3_01677 [Capronia epimyces CBS 606.96]EXJ93120.1 hypothetical protein A1O3_01677 [Capronia epimyces CBS 606.96]